MINMRQVFPAGYYMFKVNKINSRTRSEICSNLNKRCWCRSGVFFVNFENTSHIILVFLLLTLSSLMPNVKFSKQNLGYSV